MAKQLIISVSREFGSGGHEIAEILAKRFDIPIYDSNLLEEIANSKNLDADTMEKYDEKPKNVLLSRRVRGYSNSLSEVLAQMQFDYIRELANKGGSFVIVGRCAETVLKNHEALVSIFVLADMESKIARVSKHNEISRSEAEAMIIMQNKKRKPPLRGGFPYALGLIAASSSRGSRPRRPCPAGPGRNTPRRPARRRTHSPRSGATPSQRAFRAPGWIFPSPSRGKRPR